MVFTDTFNPGKGYVANQARESAHVQELLMFQGLEQSPQLYRRNKLQPAPLNKAGIGFRVQLCCQDHKIRFQDH